VSFEDDARVTPDGVAIRRLRREHGWSRRELVGAIARASERATGVPDTVSLSLLKGIEESNEPVTYAVLCRVAAGLDCDPMAVVATEAAQD
jgi:transcriptional regulator with XRE-family HTH domain